DPPKDSAAPAIQTLLKHGVHVKVLTGDNELVSKKICQEVGLDVGRVVLGAAVENMKDEELADVAERTTVFARMSPAQKRRAFLAFLPMKAVQVLTNNLLYDFSQVPIPTDNVDPEMVAKPKPWDMKELTRFIVFIGPISSVFDYTTYFVMLYVFHCWNNEGLF